MNASQRWLVVQGLWIRLWQSLTPGQHQAPEPVPVSTLSPEQQAALLAALQVGMVERVWGTVTRGLGVDPERATLSLDFEFTGRNPANEGRTYGTTRYLRLRDGDDEIMWNALESQPPLLRLLPSTEPALSTRSDVEVQDQPLDEVAARLAKALGAPVVVEEPEEELKLTAELRGKPMRLLLHWVERRTGMQWSKRGGAYVLARAIPSEVFTADPKRTLDLMLSGIPGSAEEHERETTRERLDKSISPEDHAALADGDVPFSRLSPDMQQAIRHSIGSLIHGSAAWADRLSQVLGYLGEVRLRAQPGQGGAPSMLTLEVPGVVTHRTLLLGREEWRAMLSR